MFHDPHISEVTVIRVCVFITASTYKAVRVGGGVCVFIYYCSTLLLFITAVPNTKLCAWGEEDRGEQYLLPGSVRQVKHYLN